MIFDLTILTTSDRFVGDNKAKYNMTIKFPNDKKLYQTALKVYSKNLRNVKKYDIEFAILTVSNCISILIILIKKIGPNIIHIIIIIINMAGTPKGP